MRTITRRQALITGAALAVIPLIASGQDATPEQTSLNPDEALANLHDILAQLPQTLLMDPARPAVTMFWADIASQFAATGASWDDQAFTAQALQPLALASPLFNFAADQELADALGFAVADIDQALFLGNPPVQLNIFRGAFDMDTLVPAWEASGYKQEGDTEIWSLGDEVNLDSVIGSRLVDQFNQAAILPSGDLVFSANPGLVETALAFAEGDPSLADDDAFGLILGTMPNNLVSAIATNGAFLQGNTAEPRVGEGSGVGVGSGQATPAVAEEPSLKTFVIGITAGFVGAPFEATDPGTPEPIATPATGSEFVIPAGGIVPVRFEMASEELAGQKITTVVEVWESADSFVDNRPFTDKMTVDSTATEGTIAQVDFVPVSSPSIWYDLILQQDLAPFMEAKG